MTLPEEVIKMLRSVDTDLSRAVVRLVESLGRRLPTAPAELTSYGNRAVIVVPNNRRLKERTGVELIPFPDGRALMSFDERLSIPQIELRLGDALADPQLTGADRSLFEAVLEILRSARRMTGIDLRPRSIIVLHRTRHTEPNGHHALPEAESA